MQYRYLKPPEALSDCIRTVLILQGSPLPDTSQLPLVTSGMPPLLYRNGHQGQESGSQHQLLLFGSTIPLDNIVVDEHTTIIAYFFKPFMLPALFNLPVAQILSAPFDLCTWSPHKINALRSQLIGEGSILKKVKILDRLLLLQQQEQGAECELIRCATDKIMECSDTEVLSDIQDQFKVGKRTFQRLFKKYVGISPTQYRRICQFQLSFEQVRTGKFDKLTDVAYDNGFADQSHFIRSFREFTQTTPNWYLRSGLNKKKQS